ncbi:MAG: hypothetical protein K6E62_04740 [Lachnospiraceae bacterium]|nr:hypothetical protein [Lachnospiraceae bacterium]
MKKCVNCGFIVHDDAANFCPECGNNLVPIDVPESSDSGNDGLVDSTVTEITPDEPYVPEPTNTPGNAATPVYTWFPTDDTAGSAASLVTEAPAPAETAPVETVPAAAADIYPDPQSDATIYDPVSTAAGMSMPEPPAAPSVPVENEPAYTGSVPVPASGGNGPRKLSENTIVEILDRNIDMTGKVLSSPWFILAVIGFVIFTLGSLVDSILVYINPRQIDMAWLNDLYTEFGIDFDEVNGALTDYKLGGLIGSIISVIPMILSSIGGIIMIANSKKRPIPSSGITLAKTNCVFKLVIVILCAIASVSFMIASFLIGDRFFAEYIGNDGVTAFRLLMFFIALVLLFIFLCFIFYYIGMIKTLTVAKKAGLEGKCPKNRVSIFAAVINIIAAVFLLIGFVLSVLDIQNTRDIVDCVFACSGVIYFFCAGMSMFRLKDLLTELPGIK